MENNRFVALVGAGYWGKNLLRVLYELKVLHTVCEIDERIVAERMRKFPDVYYTSSYEEVLNNREIKAVVIATPAATHYEKAKQALLANKDVFVEKPLVLNLEEGKELIEISKYKDLILMVGHIFHYHPAIIKLKQIIKDGGLGKIQYIYSNQLNIGKFRTEENVLWSFAPHDISIILMLLEEEPFRVGAFGLAALNKDIFDVTITTLEFKSGIKAHIFVSWLHPFKERKLVVVGSKAMAVFNDVSDEKLVIYPHRIEWKNGKIPVAHKAECYTVEVEPLEPLKEEMKHFIECVLERKRPRTDGEEGLRVLKILKSCEDALREGKVIEIKGQIFESGSFFVHPSSYIDENVKIGEGTKIWYFSHILQNTIIGRNCIIGQNVMIGPDVVIGDGCKIQNNVSVYKGVTLEDGVFCGPSCVFTNVITPRAFIERKHEFKPTRVKQGATIGANATIMCGVTIGRYSFIGAGAVVTSDVPDYALFLGVPARHSGWVCKCGVVLTRKTKSEKREELVCANCGSKYILDGEKFIVLEEKI
ncbi:Gfo/Idh/MocA family oxidoreductase [Thermosulfurimonas sp. F29]|uniref:Gfo/Idh/MocA family oxidoreductase n=1 Tax=Thermosulfurimonas sp. F29 TaxID=2867247 RepID=UPI001C83E0F0|nr:Gfo/Idh/MocA family oxidoreductase [Thermosulfurimonas sp. F29]MBX6423463.1 Gfo/Idh/MocA family oxidoreductase [Thermosulfurimonas sp. F29]